MKRSFLVLALLATTGFTAFCQQRLAVLRVHPFTASGVGTSEAAMLERLIVSFITELKQFRIVDAHGQEMALSETESALSLGASTSASLPLTADYIVTGALGRIGEVFVVTLENTKVSSGEKISVSDTASSISDLVLRSKELTLSLFGRAAALAPVAGAGPVAASLQAAETARVNPRASDLVGMWRGDKGLETVRLFPNGTGLAVLSGGGTIKMKMSINGDTIELVQDQPNNVSMYRAGAVTLEMARKIASEARPMRWIFKLTENGQHLFGIKESVSISGSGASMQIDNTYVRDASWARLAR
jgi:hypothetical protein